MNRSYLSWPLALLAALALVFGSIGTASAHGKLKSSVPVADSTVTTAPATVSTVFDNHDALEADGSVLQVVDASGASVDLGDSALDTSDPDRKTIVVSLKPNLAAGVYTVNWTAVSTGDGSTAEGSFSFTVSAGAAQQSAGSGRPTSAPASLPRTAGETFPVSAPVTAALLAGVGLLVRRRAVR
jgi:copper resistance protein C